jgi:hypothetical protein
MLSTMRDEGKPLALRLDMVKAAAPYLHPRLASAEQAVQVDFQEPPSITPVYHREVVDPDVTRVKSLLL